MHRNKTSTSKACKTFVFLSIKYANFVALILNSLLTFRLRVRARVFYEQIVDEAQPSRLSLEETRASSLIVL